MDKKIFFVCIILILILGILVFVQSFLNPEPKATPTPTPTSTPAGKDNLIKIDSPLPNQLVESPLTVRGEARGFWFFEADFPVKIFDEKGNLLGTAIAQAKGEWMTENFVPFEAKLIFLNSSTEKGTLVLEKNNPSDLPENQDELRIPVRFNLEEGATLKIQVSFLNENTLNECNVVANVEREVPKTQAVARAAIEELLKGPTEAEKQAGYFSNINPGVKIQSLTIENGVAKVDFNEQLEYQVGGSCMVAAIRAQIVGTLKQFPTVKETIISINGRTEDILQP